MSATTSQARVVFNYCTGFFNSAPPLAREVECATAGEIRLHNGVVIEVAAEQLPDGPRLLCCVFDETAHWRDDPSANPDVETYRAVLPSLAATGGPLIGNSTPQPEIWLSLDVARKAVAGRS